MPRPKKTIPAPIDAGFAPDQPPTEDNAAALRAQNDQMLEMLVEMQAKVEALTAAKDATPEPAFGEGAKLDAELGELLSEFKDYPQIAVFNQRVLVGADANLSIRLKDDASVTDDPQGKHLYWKLRWFNFAKEGRSHQAGAEGYEKVKWSDLQDSEMVTTGVRTDEYVRKGERGLEVLHRIPLKLYDYKKKRDAAKLKGLLSSESQVRDHVANGVASLAGKGGDNASQAGDFIHGKTHVTIEQGPTERVTL